MSTLHKQTIHLPNGEWVHIEGGDCETTARRVVELLGLPQKSLTSNSDDDEEPPLPTPVFNFVPSGHREQPSPSRIKEYRTVKGEEPPLLPPKLTFTR